ncbi:MAG: isoprenylcysteine carboxylmethyltransferase family protein [Candidatus Sericytochromatia bacterium]
MFYFFINILGIFINIFIVKDNENLISERTNPGDNIKPWDKKILGLSLLITIITYIIAGLDSGRFNWTKSYSYIYLIMGIIITIVGQLTFLIAKNQNKFFSSVARIQTDRNHEVCNIGLYKIVRHPGYLGMIISWIGFPLILGSFFSIIPVFISIILIIIRTFLEDNMLEEELNNYRDYKQNVKYRLIPIIW